MSEATRERVVKTIGAVANKPLPEDAEESLFESGLLDSFALTDLIPALEAEFGIKVPDSDLNPRKFDSIARIEAYVEAHL
jgi:acyl carrier protein